MAAARVRPRSSSPVSNRCCGKNLDAGRLRFTTSFAEIGAFGQVHFLCVGTPEGRGGPGLTSAAVYAAAEALAPHLAAPCLVVGKSTVPVGTARQVMTRMRAVAPAGDEVELAWNPEFLREGFAVQDSLVPDRIVLGVTSDGAAERGCARCTAGRSEAGSPLLVMDLETAELVKVAANAFLATKISFINAMAEVCEQAGADVIPLAEALGYDARIGGGSCRRARLRRRLPAQGHPRVPRHSRGPGRRARAGEPAGHGGRDQPRPPRAGGRAGPPGRRGLAGGRRVAVLGVAFKPDSDDVRDSPSLAVCDRLAAEGAVVSVHDPVAMPSAARKRPGLRYAPSVFEAAEGADLVLHLTEWSDYRAIDPAALAAVVARRMIIDARCCLDAALWADAGWTVHVLGRP